MNKLQKIALIGCALCIAVLFIVLLNNPNVKIGAANTSNFSDLAADSATFGTLTTTGTSTFSGAVSGIATSSLSTLTVSGTTTLSGISALSATTTLSGLTTISGATNLTSGLVTISGASSTVKIGNTTSGIAAGCLVLGDSGGATSTPVYITATGATLSATTTQPAACR